MDSRIQSLWHFGMKFLPLKEMTLGKVQALAILAASLGRIHGMIAPKACLSTDRSFITFHNFP